MSQFICLTLDGWFHYNVSQRISLSVYHIWSLLRFLDWQTHGFHQIWEVTSYYFFKHFFCHFISLFSFLYCHNIYFSTLVDISQVPQALFILLSSLFFLFLRLDNFNCLMIANFFFCFLRSTIEILQCIFHLGYIFSSRVCLFSFHNFSYLYSDCSYTDFTVSFNSCLWFSFSSLNMFKTADLKFLFNIVPYLGFVRDSVCQLPFAYTYAIFSHFFVCRVTFPENWIFQIYLYSSSGMQIDTFPPPGFATIDYCGLGLSIFLVTFSKLLFQRLSFLLSVVTEVSALLSGWSASDLREISLKFQEPKQTSNLSWSLYIGSEMGYSLNFKLG